MIAATLKDERLPSPDLKTISNRYADSYKQPKNFQRLDEFDDVAPRSGTPRRAARCFGAMVGTKKSRVDGRRPCHPLCPWASVTC
jgi:hypothetical protein